VKPKTFNEQEIERLKYLKKDLQKNGLKAYEDNKELVIEYLIRKIDEDIEFFEPKINI
jgi:hypothetical protein